MGQPTPEYNTHTEVFQKVRNEVHILVRTSGYPNKELII